MAKSSLLLAVIAGHICCSSAFLGSPSPHLLSGVRKASGSASPGIKPRGVRIEDHRRLDRRGGVTMTLLEDGAANRRHALELLLPLLVSVLPLSAEGVETRGSQRTAPAEEKRGSQRGGGFKPITDKDFPYFTGKYPPRSLDLALVPQQEKDKKVYNAWGLCIENSCGYVPLKQRYDGFKKYNQSVTTVESALLGDLKTLSEEPSGPWDSTREELLVKALRRCVLFANLLLISENYGTSNEALVSRFYINEVYYAITVLRDAVTKSDNTAAKEAWELAKDSWNSYIVIINRSIVPKVGTKFSLV